MKVAKLLPVIISVALWLPFYLSAQAIPKNTVGPRTPVPAPAEQAIDPQDLIPSFDVQFKAGDPIPGITASPVMVIPIQCNGDGAALIDMLMPPDFRDRTIYLVRPTMASAIPVKNIPGLSNIQIVNVFASHSLVGVLLYATKVTTDSSKPKDYSYFIATFDPNNGYRGTIEIPISYQVYRFAILPSGDFVVFGYDTAGNTPRLWLLDSSGAFKRAIQLPEKVQDAVTTVPKDKKLDAMPYPIADSMRASTAFGNPRFTAYGEKVIFGLAGKNSVLEIGNGGSVREVQIESPKGYDFDAFIPSNDRWIVQFKRSGLPDSGQVDIRPETQNILFYEVTASDGTLRRRLNLGSDPIGSIACEKDGVLMNFKTDDKQHLIPMTADLGK
jgi:hypothetical protein